MARRATLTQGTLVALGVDTLAKLVLDEVQQNTPFKRIITAALAGSKGPGAVAGIVDRRLASLERARGYIDWDNADVRGDVDTFMKLEAQRPERIRDNLAIAERLLQAGRGKEAPLWVRRPNRTGLRVMDRQDLADNSGGIDVLERHRVGLEIRILRTSSSLPGARPLLELAPS